MQNEAHDRRFFRFRPKYKGGGFLARLDLKTRLFLFATGAKIVRCDADLYDTNLHDVDSRDANTRDVYVFEDYDDYMNYFRVHIGDCLDEDLIKKAIYTTGKRGQIVAFKGLCEYIVAALGN